MYTVGHYYLFFTTFFARGADISARNRYCCDNISCTPISRYALRDFWSGVNEIHNITLHVVSRCQSLCTSSFLVYIPDTLEQHAQVHEVKYNAFSEKAGYSTVSKICNCIRPFQLSLVTVTNNWFVIN